MNRHLVRTLVVCVVASCLSDRAIGTGPFAEPPALGDEVRAGNLPPVRERLPREPAVVDTGGKIGRYGGRMRVISSTPNQLSELSVILPEPLLRFDPDGRTVVPNVARHWELSDDGTSITIHLRAGMRWSDGEPVTVDDVLFAYDDVLRNEAITPVFPSRYLVGGEPMEVERIDDTTFRMRFAEPYGAIAYMLTHARGPEALLLPKHWLRRFHPRYRSESQLADLAREHGFSSWQELFRDRNALSKPWGVTPQTAPDYPTLSAWNVASVPSPGHVVLERNPYYWKVDREGNQLPYIDSIVSTQISQKEAQSIEIISGKVDLAAMEGPFEDAPLFLSHRQRGGYRVHFWECNWGTRVACYLNQTVRDPVLRDIFQNRDFRIALSLGINRQEINEVLYFGQCMPRQLTVNRVCSYFEESFVHVHAEYDLDRANRMLDEIGLKRRRPGGWRLRPDGKILAISCPVLNGGFRPQTAELIKDYWEDLGILVAVRIMEPTLWFTRAQANSLDILLRPDDVATDVMVLSTMVYGIQHWGRTWFMYLNSQGRTGEKPPDRIMELYEIWLRMRSTTDVSQRAALGRQLIRSQAENLWGIGTVGRNTRPIIVSNRLKNVPSDGLWGYPWLATALHHPEQFFLEEDDPESDGAAERRSDEG